MGLRRCSKPHLQHQSCCRGKVDKCIERKLVQLALQQIIEPGTGNPQPGSRSALRELPSADLRLDRRQQIGARAFMLAACAGVSARASNTSSKV